MSDGFYGWRLQFWQIYGYISFSIIHLELKRQKCSYALLLHSKHDARICKHKSSDATYDVLTRLKVSNKWAEVRGVLSRNLVFAYIQLGWPVLLDLSRSVLSYNQWSDQITTHSMAVSIIHWKRLCPWFFFIVLFFSVLKLRFPRRLTPSRWLSRDTIVELPREVDQKKTTIETRQIWHPWAFIL